MTVANPFGIQHSARFGVALGPSSGGHACLTYRLCLDAVREREGALVVDFSRSFLGIVGPVRMPRSVPGGGVAERFEEDARLSLLDAAEARFAQVEVIPARSVRSVLRDLMAGRRVLRGWLGVRFSVCGEAGVKVASMTEKGPAAGAGLRTGDTLVEANGRPITTLDALFDLALWVEYEGLGKDAVLTIRREGESEPVTLVIPVGLRSRS